MAERFCEAFASGLTLTEAAKSVGLSRPTIQSWVTRYETFATQYAQARQAKLDLMSEGLAALAAQARGQPASEVQAVKLEVDTHKWLLSKLEPHTYGDKLDVTSKGEALAAPSHQVDARVQSIVMQAAMRMKAGETLTDEAAGLLE